MMDNSEDKAEKEPRAYAAYQKLADSYAARVETKPHNAYYERPAMLAMLPEDLRGKRVLDCGCGPGVYAEHLVSMGAVVDAFDVSERMLDLAAKRLGNAAEDGPVTLHRIDMTQPLTMFADQSFDVVNAPLCLDYVKDWTSVFREFLRVLKPGGHFQFSAGHPSFDAEYFRTRDYFSIEAVECEWSGFDIKIRMPSYRRSLEVAINSVIDAGLIISRVHEPLPTEEFRKSDPRRYKRLMHRPCFICISAMKPE